MKQDNIIAAISGFSFTTAYLILDKALLNLYTAGLAEFCFIVLKAGVVALIGGACGLAGKDLYNYLRKKYKK